MNNEKYFDKSIAEKFPEMLRTLALIYLIISTIGISLLTQLIPVKKEVFLGENLENECPSVKVALKTKQFWLLFLMSACSVGPGIYFLYVYKGFAMETLNDDEFLTLVGSVGLLFNGGFRSIWGDFMDRTSFKVSYAVLVIIQIVMSLTLFYTVTEKWVYLVWIAVILICEGGNFSLFPTIFAKMYGRK